MNQRVAKIKSHLKENKKVYIAATVGVVVGAVSVLVFKKSNIQTTQRATNAALINWKPKVIQEQITILDLPARGHRGYTILNTTTKEIYASGNEAASSLGVSRTTVARHLKGLCDDIHGNVLVNLGENLSEQVKVST